MPRGYKKKILQHPEVLEDWKQKLRSSSMTVGFQIRLTRAMLEYLCAVADDVTWDRGIFRSMEQPDNWIASKTALINRGLIKHKPDEAFEERNKQRRRDPKKAGTDEVFYGWNTCELTPAGQCMIDMLKMAGIFQEQAMAAGKRAIG